MVKGPNISRLLLRAMETNVRFYEGLVNLSVNYVNSLVGIITESQSQPSAESKQPVRPQPESPAIVLEAEAGKKALGYFLIENQLSRKVSAEVIASPIIDADGNEVEQKIYFEPATVTLEPGEKMVVQIIADINEGLVPGVGYRGNIAVPGLSERSAAIVVRRRHSAEATNEQNKSAPKNVKTRTSMRRSVPSSSATKKQG